MQRRIALGGLVVVLSALAACAPKPAPAPPPPPPPPPPPVAVIPPRPLPPFGASPNLTIPPVGPDGVRHTVNSGLSTAQTVWNLRSAYNVAALNCLKPEYSAILPGYKAFLKTNVKVLAAANRTMDREFRAKYGRSATAEREAYLTRVYNFFAQPPTLGNFCDAALNLATDGNALKPTGLDAFAAAELPRLDSVFQNFYLAYGQWQSDAALWDAHYAPRASQPAIAAQPGPAPMPATGG